MQATASQVRHHRKPEISAGRFSSAGINYPEPWNQKLSGWTGNPCPASTLGLRFTWSWSKYIYSSVNPNYSNYFAYSIILDLLKNNKTICQEAFKKNDYSIDNPHDFILSALDISIERWLKMMKLKSVNIDIFDAPIVTLHCGNEGWVLLCGITSESLDGLELFLPDKESHTKKQYEFLQSFYEGIRQAFNIPVEHDVITWLLDDGGMEESYSEEPKVARMIERDMWKTRRKILNFFSKKFNPELKIPRSFSRKKAACLRRSIPLIVKMINLNEIKAYHFDLEEYISEFTTEQLMFFVIKSTEYQDQIYCRLESSFESTLTMPRMALYSIESAEKINATAIKLLKLIIEFLYGK